MKLAEFSNEERQLLVSCPYRVGMWISNVDDIEGSARDDRREKQALSIAIERLAKKHRKMPFASAVMRALEGAKSNWGNWAANSAEGDILQDLEAALAACKQKASKRDLSEYKHAVWQIAMIIAQAYDEDHDPDNEMHVNNFIEWIVSMTSKPKLQKRPDNISQTEKRALKKLQAVLKA